MIRKYKKTVIGLVAFVVVTFFAAASADSGVKFDKTKFLQAQKEGKTILVAVHADWCPTCKKQGPIIEKLSKESAYKKVMFFVVNFDKDWKAVNMFKVSHQSTLIVFSGTKERGRSVGQTDPEKIKELLDQGK